METPSLPTVDPAPYIRRVGRGRTLSGSLDRRESAEAFRSLLHGGFTEAQAGAFLQALRIKELTRDELDGLMDCFYAAYPGGIPSLAAGGFTLNLASDTPRKGGYASLIAASLLAGGGMPVGAVRSDPMLSGNRNSWEGTLAVLEGIPEARPPVSAEADALVPGLEGLRRLRGELGFRSCLHTAEKLLNPWPGRTLVLGISHAHYAERLAEHLLGRNQQAKIVLGNHGTPDLVLHKATEIWEVRADGIGVLRLEPGELGLEPDTAVYSQAFFPQWAAEARKPGFGALGPVLNYHMAFLRYAAGEIAHPREGRIHLHGAA